MWSLPYKSFYQNSVHISLLISMHVTCHAHLTMLYLITLLLSGEVYGV
jgi:hypothetical protein